MDKNPAYPAAIRVLKQEGLLPPRVRLRQCKYLNNVIEQDHGNVKKPTWLAKGYKAFQSAWRTLEGIETVNMIRKGRVRWIAKKDVAQKPDSLRDSLASPPDSNYNSSPNSSHSFPLLNFAMESLQKGNIAGQVRFVNRAFGLAA